MSDFLQTRLSEVKCAVLNYKNNKIETSEFYSEEMYNKFLLGVSCRKGMGLYDITEKVEFNQLEDGVLVVVLHGGVEYARYKYKTIHEEVIQFKKTIGNKSIIGKISIRIRKDEYHSGYNYRANELKEKSDDKDKEEREKINLDFDNVDDIKTYLNSKYNLVKPLDWSHIK